MSRQPRLLDKVAVITGASAGIGLATTRLFRSEGAKVVMFARSADKLRALEAELGPEALAVPGDVTVWDDVQRLMAATLDRFGRIDILVNNAGIGIFAPVVDLDPEDLDRLLAVNLKGPFLCCKAALPAMIRQQSGHIINVSSVAGTTTFPGGAGYCASKWGLEALTQTLIQECKPHKIKVSSINPGSVKTGFGGKGTGPGQNPPKPYSLEPEDVARLITDVAAQPPGVIVNQVIVRPLVPPEWQ